MIERVGQVAIAYLVQGDQVVELENGAAIVWVDADLLETDAPPSAEQVREWIDRPEAGVQVADLAELLEAED